MRSRACDDRLMKRPALLAWTALMLLAGAIVLVGLPRWLALSREHAIKQCTNNHRQVFAAMCAYAREMKYRAGDPMDEGFCQYLKEGKVPECPSGGTYEIPRVGGRVRCTVHGDLLLGGEVRW